MYPLPAKPSELGCWPIGAELSLVLDPHLHDFEDAGPPLIHLGDGLDEDDELESDDEESISKRIWMKVSTKPTTAMKKTTTLNC